MRHLCTSGEIRVEILSCGANSALRFKAIRFKIWRAPGNSIEISCADAPHEQNHARVELCQFSGMLVSRSFLLPFHARRGFAIDILANTSLYLRGRASEKKRSLVLPYFDLVKIVNNAPEIERQAQLRGRILDLSPLRDAARNYTVIRKELMRLEAETTKLDLEERRTRDIAVTAKLRELRAVLRNVKSEFYKVDTICAPLLLQTPNMILTKNIEPITSLCKTYVPPRDLGFEPKSHVELGGRNLQFMNQTLCYLLEDLAGLEQRICDLFIDKLDQTGRTPVSGPDFVVDTIVEGAATDNNIIVEDQESGGHQMHLTGGSSLEAFCAQFVRLDTGTELMRQYACARFYREGSVEGGLYTLSQSTRVSAFTGSDREVLDDVHELLRLLVEVYASLEIPFRLRLVDPPELSFVEQLRVDLEIWSPFEKTWKPVAHVASHGQFIASRLTMISRGEPMFTMFGVCADAQRIIGLLLENHQNPDGTYSMPKHLVTC
ncbi:uncharacterized protein LOC100904609 [Galendromus occidentalis]|uniref:Uncharacterized protein LOC100904609 n=1 Tax=Galendromus occidentalis TaxID=34638 RepID=A0AAJ6VXE8_9ACAR|nr:uncharacterized protein LOC100904609 [Galendromus occidentalis]